MFAKTLSVSASIHQILPVHETNPGVGRRNRRSQPRQLVEFALESHAPRQGHHSRWARNFCFLLTSESNLRQIESGFGGGRNLTPSPDLRKAYFSIGDYNIIIVDYGPAVREPCLSQLEWSPRFASLCIAQLIKYVARHPRGVAPDFMHFIGYSVGAHMSGLVANYLKPAEGKIGRITGLDPTIFVYAGSNNSRDLDPSDAHFVDILHSSAGILGQWHSGGHADFYINGGTSQPGGWITINFEIVRKYGHATNLATASLKYLLKWSTIVTKRVVCPNWLGSRRSHEDDTER